jgi:hypothetical protein
MRPESLVWYNPLIQNIFNENNSPPLSPARLVPFEGPKVKIKMSLKSRYLRTFNHMKSTLPKNERRPMRLESLV